MFFRNLKEQINIMYKIIKSDIPDINRYMISNNNRLEQMNSWLSDIEERYNNLERQNRELLDYIAKNNDNKIFIYNGEKYLVSEVTVHDSINEEKRISVEMSKVN